VVTPTVESARRLGAYGGWMREQEVLAAELAGLKPSALRKRALAAGVGEAAVEEAQDSADPQVAMVELILGTGPAPTPARGVSRVCRPNQLFPIHLRVLVCSPSSLAKYRQDPCVLHRTLANDVSAGDKSSAGGNTGRS
jgi:hypothetical protein